jgi:hypothetical protein
MERLFARITACKSSLLTGLLIVGAVVVTTRADITGYNNGVNFTVNSPSGGGDRRQLHFPLATITFPALTVVRHPLLRPY